MLEKQLIYRLPFNQHRLAGGLKYYIVFVCVAVQCAVIASILTFIPLYLFSMARYGALVFVAGVYVCLYLGVVRRILRFAVLRNASLPSTRLNNSSLPNRLVTAYLNDFVLSERRKTAKKRERVKRRAKASIYSPYFNIKTLHRNRQKELYEKLLHSQARCIASADILRSFSNLEDGDSRSEEAYSRSSVSRFDDLSRIQTWQEQCSYDLNLFRNEVFSSAFSKDINLRLRADELGLRADKDTQMLRYHDIERDWKDVREMIAAYEKRASIPGATVDRQTDMLESLKMIEIVLDDIDTSRSGEIVISLLKSEFSKLAKMLREDMEHTSNTTSASE